jgi:hypothetical protein
MTDEQFDALKSEVDAALPTDYTAHYSWEAGPATAQGSCSLSIVIDKSVAAPTPAQLVIDQRGILKQVHASIAKHGISFVALLITVV